MSKLDEIWDLFGRLQQNRNLRAHYREELHLELNLTHDADSEVTTRLWNAFIDAYNPPPVGGLELLRQPDWLRPDHYTPKPIVDFVAKIAKRIQPASVLDPVCGYGMLLAGTADVESVRTVHGVDINAQAVQIASAVVGEQPILILGDSLAPHEGLLRQYDLIVADPPIGKKLNEDQAAALGLTSRPLEFTDGLIVWSASRLTEHGIAVVAVSPSFFFSKQSKQIQNAIQEAGCRIGAAIHIPSGTWESTSMDSYLLIVEPGVQEDIFVGQLSPDTTHQDQLVANLMRRKPNGSPTLGRICPLSDFTNFEAFVAKENLSRISRVRGWTEYSAESVFPEHASVRGDGKEEELSDDANSVYLKLVGKGTASTRIDELRTGTSKRPREVLHLKVDPLIADPDFMVNWLNESRIGRLWLDTLRNGTTIPRIRTVDLLRSKIHLPPISEQKLVVEGAAYLGKIRAETEELESALWSGTESSEVLVERIQSINQKDHYEDWMETLPFPLASILWRHRASKDSYRHQYEMLLHFFEATAAFLATVHLSALMEDNEAWEEYGRSLSEKLREQNLSLDRVTFGAWKLAAELLGGACGSMIKDEQQEHRWQQIYGTTDRKIMEMFSNSKLRGILQQANKIRNDWQGHRGAISEDTAKNIHDQLMGLVHQLRGLFGRNWQRYELIQPDKGHYRQGLHHVTCKRLMGTRSAPFEERLYESRHPLEAESLYLFDSVHQSGLQLRPFIEVIPSPEKKAVACFIFNRRENEGTARWISYHFEQESEISHASEGLDAALAMLRQFEN